MNLFELLTSTYPYKLEKGRYGWDGTFKTADGHDINLVAALSGQFEGLMEVEFSRVINGSSTHNVNNKGDAYKILATVIRMMKEIVKKAGPDYVYFVADNKEPSRVQLYQAICKRAEKDGYKRVDMKAVVSDPNGDQMLKDFAEDMVLKPTSDFGNLFVLNPN